MSKPIYEEALEIMIDNILPREGDKVNKTKVIKALLQAQKQEKLLELYRELSIKERKRATTLKTKNVDKYNQLNKEIEIINEHIKEL